MNGTIIGVGAVAAWSAMLSPMALAHHSVAMFDHDRKITLQATVKEFQYTKLLRKGIKAKTFSPGDKVMIVAHPMKDGRTAGALLSATAADGHVYAP
jgi:hypothetical protein